MKNRSVSCVIVVLLSMLLGCQYKEESLLNQPTSPTKSRARYAFGAGVSFDISAQYPLYTSGNCRQYYAPASQSYKNLVTVTVSVSDGGTKTFLVKGNPACPGCNCSSYQAVSLGGGYTSSTSSGWTWTVSGSGTYTMTFYVTMGNASSGSCQADWSVGLQSPTSIPANDCSVGTGDAIRIVKDI